MSRRVAQPNGFTMVELVMTLIVLGILAVAVLPRFASKISYDTRGFSDQARAAVQYARKVAVASGRRVCVVTTAANLTLTMASSRGQGAACGPAVIDPSTGAGFVVPKKPISGVSLSVISLSFFADGSADVTGAATPYKITVTGDTSYDILIERETGHVH